MNTRIAFRAAVGVGVVVLMGVALVLVMLVKSGFLFWEFGLGFFNLLTDIVVGGFTIWGLYWAASELALKPELRLSIKPVSERTSSKWLYPDRLFGSKKKGLLELDLFLVNTRPKAARNIQVVLCYHSFPLPSFSVGPVEGAFPNWVPFGLPWSCCLRAQFGDDFVIYKGFPVRVGVLKVGWPHLSADNRPRELTFEVRLYSLESEPKKEVISFPIIWG